MPKHQPQLPQAWTFVAVEVPVQALSSLGLTPAAVLNALSAPDSLRTRPAAVAHLSPRVVSASSGTVHQLCPANPAKSSISQ